MQAISRVDRCFLAIAFAVLALACGCQDSGPPVSDPRPDSVALQRDSTSSVIHDYYRAINERRYGDAYVLWVARGAASGKSLEAFRDGFASTASVDVALSPPGRVEGAAGSRYVEIPVRITALQTDGSRQAFEGKYTLRRSVVDGATADQRARR